MKVPIDFLRERWKLMLIVFGILLLFGGLFGDLLPLVNLGGIILILGIVSSLVLPGKGRETPRPRTRKSKAEPAKGSKADSAKSFPAKYVVIALVVIAVLVLSQSEPGPTMTALEPGPGGGEVSSWGEFPLWFWALIGGGILYMIVEEVIQFNVHTVDPRPFPSIDSQNLATHVDIAFTWWIVDLAQYRRFMFFEFLSSLNPFRKKEGNNSADKPSHIVQRRVIIPRIEALMNEVTQLSCYDAHRQRESLATAWEERVNAVLGEKAGVALDLVVQGIRYVPHVQRDVDKATTRRMMAEVEGESVETRVRKITGWPANLPLNWNAPGVCELTLAIVAADSQIRRAESLGGSLESLLPAVLGGRDE